MVFFVLPVLWLLLAATKTDDQLVHGNPLSLRLLRTRCKANWDALTAFQDDADLHLAAATRRSTRSSRWSSPCCVAIPAGYALAMTEFRGRRTLLSRPWS